MKQISLLKSILIAGCITVLATGAAMAGISGISVKADATNTVSEADAFDWTGEYAGNGYDAKWSMQDWGNGITALTSYALFDEANGIGEDCPSITTFVKGLDTSKTYDVYVQFLTHPAGNWAIYANLNWTPNTLLTKNNSTSTGIIWGDGPISEYKLGTITGLDAFYVNVDDYHNSPTFALSQYYGVSYVDVTPASVPEPSALLALATGLCGIFGASKRFSRK